MAGVSYDARLFQTFLFENFMLPDCKHESCRNLCSRRRGMNVTCYLVDEHGIIVLSTMEHLLPKFYKVQQRDTPMGKPLQQVNPWLMKQLEYAGIYNLIIPGHTLPVRLIALRLTAGLFLSFSGTYSAGKIAHSYQILPNII